MKFSPVRMTVTAVKGDPGTLQRSLGQKIIKRMINSASTCKKEELEARE